MTHNRLNTLCTGDNRETIARPCDRGTFTTISADSKVAAVHQYDGILRVLPIDPIGKVQPHHTFMARVDEIAILRICFLYNTYQGMPVLAILHEDYRTKVRRCGAAQIYRSLPIALLHSTRCNLICYSFALTI
jgi:hypothetical protein